MMRTFVILTLLTFALPPQLAAQRLIERTPNLPNTVSALPGMLEASLTHRFSRAAGVSGLASVATFDLAFGMPLPLPVQWTAGVRFSPAGADRGDEWELYDRFGLLRQAVGSPVDVNVTGAWNFRSGSLDAEAALARRAGPLRLLAAARALGVVGDDDMRVAAAAGAVWQLAPRSTPVALTADFATLLDRAAGEAVVWTAGVQTGLPHTALSLSLHATNAASTSLRGTSAGTRRTRWGIELNTPVEFSGFLLGIYASREHARRAVGADATAPPAHSVRMYGYVYAPAALYIRTGDVVEWINDDAVVHTVTAENSGFDSRGIPPGERWRAQFSEPGVYPYYCGPHPFMKGVIVVR